MGGLQYLCRMALIFGIICPMMQVMLFVRRTSRQGHAVLDRNLETNSYVTVYLCESLFITARLRSVEVLLTTDKASIQASLLVVEDGKALVELGKNINARHVETGYGRLFFRYGRGLSASIKHLIVDGKTLADVGHNYKSLAVLLLRSTSSAQDCSYDSSDYC
jgi:hypothetical protein